MSDVITATESPSTAPLAALPAVRTVPQPRDLEKPRVPIVLGGEVVIPGWIVDLESFRRWAMSDEFPTRGRFSYLNGLLWVDLDMEQIFSHVDVKTEYACVLRLLTKSLHRGRFLTDGALLTDPVAGLSNEPDGLYFSFDSLNAGRICLVDGAKAGYVELRGAADMVLEIVSDSSVKKDTDVLRDLYWHAGVTEFWLVDARQEEPQFDILTRGADGFTATAALDGWLFSAVFGKQFRLRVEKNSLGLPMYTLDVRD